MLTESKKAFIEFMMSADVLRFGSFVTKSGRNTPYFVNTGNYKTGEQIAKARQVLRIASLRRPSAKISPPCSARRTRVFRLPQPPPRPSITSMASRSPLFNRKEEKDHGEGGSLVGYKPKDGDKIIIIEDVITAGTAVCETMPILYGCGNVKVNDMFISVNRCEVGKVPRQNRHHGGQRGVRHQGPRHRHRRGHPRVLKAVRKIQQYPPRHGRLHGKILHPVKLTSA